MLHFHALSGVGGARGIDQENASPARVVASDSGDRNVSSKLPTKCRRAEIEGRHVSRTARHGTSGSASSYSHDSSPRCFHQTSGAVSLEEQRRQSRNLRVRANVHGSARNLPRLEPGSPSMEVAPNPRHVLQRSRRWETSAGSVSFSCEERTHRRATVSRTDGIQLENNTLEEARPNGSQHSHPS